MATLDGFWSYVHKDDEAEGGRIAQLAKDLVAEYEMIGGDPINLFLDQDALKWGDSWRSKVDNTLSAVVFFVAVLTPRYFKSAECRRELKFFANRAAKIKVKGLVLPLLYVDVPVLRSQDDSDELAVLIRDFQWEDWCDLRFADPASEKYRRGVSRLAVRLLEANRQAEEQELSSEAVAEEDADDTPGLIDRLARAEDALPEWSKTVSDLRVHVETIGSLINEANDAVTEANGQRRSFSYRLGIVKQLASKLQGPTDAIRGLAKASISQLSDVDEGVRLIVASASEEIEANPDVKEDVCDFFESVFGLAQAVDEAMRTTEEMVISIQPIEKMSRDLRPVLRDLRKGLTGLVESRGVVAGWVKLIQDSGVECDWIQSPDSIDPERTAPN